MIQKFSDLPKGAKDALLQFDRKEGELKAMTLVEDLDTFYKELYPSGFSITEVPTHEFVNQLFAKTKSMHDWVTWENYLKDFVASETIPEYSTEDRYYILVSEDCSDTIVDGWHRLVSYVTNDHETIPVLNYKYK